MKHYGAKPSAQLPKHIKNLQDDTKHAVMKPETSMNLRNAYAHVPRVLFASWTNHMMS